MNDKTLKLMWSIIIPIIGLIALFLDYKHGWGMFYDEEKHKKP